MGFAVTVALACRAFDALRPLLPSHTPDPRCPQRLAERRRVRLDPNSPLQLRRDFPQRRGRQLRDHRSQNLPVLCANLRRTPTCCPVSRPSRLFSGARLRENAILSTPSQA